jgi:sulfate/thiosulfate transport system permease protein
MTPPATFVVTPGAAAAGGSPSAGTVSEPRRQRQRPRSTEPRLGRLVVRSMVVVYLGLFIALPVGAVVRMGFRKGLAAFGAAIVNPDTLSALGLTVQTSLAMALINAVMGTWIAYVLARVPFPGRRLVNALIDLPFAIPTLVTGVMLVVLFGPQEALGGWLKNRLGISIIFAPPGIILALMFVTFPFVVRAVQPVLINMDRKVEDAAATLGAGAWTIFRRITLPQLALPLLSGALLCFGRAIGEFGSIVIVAGNIPFYTQTAAVYVLGQVESENRLGASAVSLVMIAIAFGLILLVDGLERRAGRNAR